MSRCSQKLSGSVEVRAVFAKYMFSEMETGMCMDKNYILNNMHKLKCLMNSSTNHFVSFAAKSYNVRMDAERPVIAAPAANTSPQSSDVFKCPKKV